MFSGKNPVSRPTTLCALILLVLFGTLAAAEPVTVAWDPNPAAEQVTGYLLYYGETSRLDPGFVAYDAEIDVGNVTEYTVDLPDAGIDYYLAVIAYNGAGLNSDYSDEVLRQGAVVPTFTVACSASGGGVITPSGSVSVEQNGNLTVSIAPDVGYSIADVVVDGASVGAVSSYTLSNVTAGHTISATFTLNTYNVTLSAGTGGSVSPSGSVTVDHGGSLTVSITPDTGYSVADVVVDGASMGAVSSYTLSNVTTAHTITASFVNGAYSVAVSAGAGGSVSPSGSVSVDPGGSLTLSITPDTGYSVADVVVDGASVGAVNSYTLSNVTADHTISATFALSTYNVTLSAGTGGSVSPSGSVTVEHGGSLTVSITPDTGYSVADVVVDGASVGAVSSYTLSNVTADHVLSVGFTADPVAPTPPTGLRVVSVITAGM